jgi:hypothetical protein
LAYPASSKGKEAAAMPDIRKRESIHRPEQPSPKLQGVEGEYAIDRGGGVLHEAARQDPTRPVRVIR